MRSILHGTVLKGLLKTLVLISFFSLASLPSFAQTSAETEGILRASDIETLSDEEILEQAREAGLDVKSADEARRVLLERAGVPLTGADGVDVTIESGDNFRTFTLEKTAENMVELKGDVVLSFKERNTSRSHRVRARRIVWAEDRQTLWAEGDVGYILSEGSEVSRFQGSSLFLSLPEKRVFLSQILGKTPWSMSGENVQLSFGGTTLSGVTIDDEQIQIVERGFLTTSRIPTPYYRLQAQKIWILGKDEWAVYNAVLYIGEVPVFYFPFYLHTDKQFLFYPQVGFDPYRGAFLMTTTYLIGQQMGISNAFTYNANKQLFSFGGQAKKRTRGLWWENTDETTENNDYLKLMVDDYFNLGFYASLDFYFARDDKNFYRGHFGLALSRTLYPHEGDFFYPFPNDPTHEYTLLDLFIPNKTYLFGWEIPLRWAFLYEQEQERDEWKFKIQAEHYSDSFVYRDFLLQRKENTNPWLSFVMIPYSDYLTISPRFDDSFYTSSGYLWNFTNPLVTQFAQNFTLTYQKEGGFHPLWLRSFKWEVTQAGFLWNGRPDQTRSIYDPRSSWFYLQEINFPQMNFEIRGALFEWNQNERKPEVPKTEEGDAQTPKPAEKPEKEDPILLAPSPLDSETVFGKPAHNSSFGLYYNYTPYLGFKTFWDGSNWEKPEEMDMSHPDYVNFNWKNYLNLQGIGSFWGRFLVLQTSTTVNSNWLATFWESDVYRNQRYTRDDVSLAQSISVGSYFAQDYSLFRNSYIRQTVDFTLFSYTQDYARGNMIRDWGYLSKKGSLTKNETELFAEVSNEYGGASYKFNFNAPSENWLLKDNFRTWFTFHPLKGESLWGFEKGYGKVWKPYLWQNYLIYNPVPDVIVRTGVSYNPTLNQLDSVEIFFKVNLFEFGFWYRQLVPQIFDPTLRNWRTKPGFEGGKTEFKPYKLRFAFVGDAVKLPFMKGQGLFFLNLDTGYETLLERFTEGEFWFKWRMGFRLNNFTEFSVASFSNNTQFFRYFPSFLNRLGVPEARINFWEDLGDSLSFWDPVALSRGNFKWQSFELRFRQIFYDWFWDTTWTATPVRREYMGTQKLEFRHTFSISVRWTPMRSVRAYIEKDSTDDGYKTGIGDDTLTGSTFF